MRKTHQAAGRGRRGFSLVEMLVVLAIIGVLAGLLLVGIQSVRENAYRLSCQNNLQQIGLAWMNHERVKKTLPTGGWGKKWIGDPDRGFDNKQPGGWVYNILPFVEAQNQYDMGAGQAGGAKETAIMPRLSDPLKVFNCPSRRTSKAYPNINSGATFIETGSNTFTTLARSDYAANCGSQAVNDLGDGPASLIAGDTTFAWPSTSTLTGVCFMRSQLRMSDLSKGVTQTYLVGEKYMNTDNYTNGQDAGDGLSMYNGFGPDNFRTTSAVPMHDTKGVTNALIFGGPHRTGCNFVFADGSVKIVKFDITLSAYKGFGDR